MNQGATHTNIIFILTKILFKTQSDIRMAATVQGREEEKLQVAGLLDQSFKPSAWSANRFCPSSHFLHLSPLSGRGKKKICNYFCKDKSCGYYMCVQYSVWWICKYLCI